MHVSAKSATAHENPIDGVELGRARQEVRAVVMLSKLCRDVLVAVAPPEVPRLGARFVFQAIFVHLESFEKVLEARLVAEKLTVERLHLRIFLLVKTFEIREVENFRRCPVLRRIGDNHNLTVVRVVRLEVIRLDV